MRLSDSVFLQSQENQVDTLIVDNDIAQAQISLFGGQVLSYVLKSDHRDRLWLSDAAVLDGTKAIRGGIPVCWPWFGDHSSSGMPAHGYVRTQAWHVIDCVDSAGSTQIKLKPENVSGAGFDGAADLQLSITIADELTLQLTTMNLGAKPFQFGAALHSYFSIENIRQVQLEGVTGEYLDKAENFKRKRSLEPFVFNKETDNIHLGPIGPVAIKTKTFSINIDFRGHDSLVVWNPWIDKSLAMADMRDDGYQSMLCVEAAVTQGISLGGGDQHTLTQIIK